MVLEWQGRRGGLVQSLWWKLANVYLCVHVGMRVHVLGVREKSS